mgnify:FL=1
MPMSSPRKLTSALLLAALVFPISAHAGLYGFDEAHPYTPEEKLLSIDVPPHSIKNYRDLLRENVIALSNYAKANRPDFQIMVHEGQDLLTRSLWEYHLDGYLKARNNGEDVSDPSFLLNLKQTSPEFEPLVGGRSAEYLKSIDAVVVNNHFCQKLPLNPVIVQNGIKAFSVDLCPDGRTFDRAISASLKEKIPFYGFLSSNKAFRKIAAQPIIKENAENIFDLKSAQNISFLLKDNLYADKNDFIEAVRASNYDVVVIEPYFRQRQPFTPEEINAMKYKKNGTRRQLLARFSVTEAKDTDYYWNNSWKIGSPDWLVRASFVEPRGVITRYWDNEWKNYMSRYFQGIIKSGYDGAFLTGLENHRYFENLTPLE